MSQRKEVLNLFQSLAIWVTLVLMAAWLLSPDVEASDRHHGDTTVIVNVDGSSSSKGSSSSSRAATGTAGTLASAGLKYRFKKSLQLGVGYGYADGSHGFSLGVTGTQGNSMVSGSLAIEPALQSQEGFIGGNVGVTW